MLGKKPLRRRIDLDFRPESYWAADNPVSAIVQNIKGENRRQMARDFVTGQRPGALGGIHVDLLADTISREGSVKSEGYPQLGAYYNTRMLRFVEEWVAENREPGDENKR